jgi:hypothetical protein
MKPNLPNWLFLGGVGALGVSNTIKETLPNTLGRVYSLHWSCGIVSGILFSVGVFLSLRGLFAAPARRGWFLLPLYCHLLFL